MKDKTIFVSIVSYRDFDITNTIDDLFDKAEHPTRIISGVFLQDTIEENKRITEWVKNHTYSKNIKLETISYTEAQGCGWARNYLLHNIYIDSDYFFCIDSHSRFLKYWDTEYIQLYSGIPSKGVISVFPQSFEFGDSYGIYTQNNTPHIYTPIVPIWHPHRTAGHHQRPALIDYEKIMTISGGNFFGVGDIAHILKVNMYFTPTEEQEIYSLLLYKSGYDIFTVSKNIVWHKYISDSSNSYRELCDWNRFNPEPDFINNLKDFGGTERTTEEWKESVLKECNNIN